MNEYHKVVAQVSVQANEWVLQTQGWVMVVFVGFAFRHSGMYCSIVCTELLLC